MVDDMPWYSTICLRLPIGYADVLFAGKCKAGRSILEHVISALEEAFQVSVHTESSMNPFANTCPLPRAGRTFSSIQ